MSDYPRPIPADKVKILCIRQDFFDKFERWLAEQEERNE